MRSCPATASSGAQGLAARAVTGCGRAGSGMLTGASACGMARSGEEASNCSARSDGPGGWSAMAIARSAEDPFHEGYGFNRTFAVCST